MSFTFGAFNTAAHPGMLATLKAWPSPTLKPETVDLLDGTFYARTGIAPTTFEFDVRLSAATPAQVLALRDELVAGCSPALGVQALVPEVGAGWVWWAATQAIDDFKRGLWIKGVECQLRGTLAFLVPDGVGWANPDETATGTASVTITRTKGNLPSHPKITVGGPFSSVTLNIGGREITVDVPVAAGQRLVLDWQHLDFGVWAGGVKVAHAAKGMSTFERVSLPLGATPVTASATGGSVSSLTVAANSRRA